MKKLVVVFLALVAMFFFGAPIGVADGERSLELGFGQRDEVNIDLFLDGKAISREYGMFFNLFTLRLDAVAKECQAPGYYQVFVIETADIDNLEDRIITVLLIGEEKQVFIHSQRASQLKGTKNLRLFVRESAGRIFNRIKNGLGSDKLAPAKEKM